MSTFLTVLETLITAKNMEIYAYTLHGNITSDVKKKKGGGRPH
jgi:hypothetical protein